LIFLDGNRKQKKRKEAVVEIQAKSDPEEKEESEEEEEGSEESGSSDSRLKFLQLFTIVTTFTILECF
jgi:hypothetical protein